MFPSGFREARIPGRHIAGGRSAQSSGEQVVRCPTDHRDHLSARYEGVGVERGRGLAQGYAEAGDLGHVVVRIEATRAADSHVGEGGDVGLCSRLPGGEDHQLGKLLTLDGVTGTEPPIGAAVDDALVGQLADSGGIGVAARYVREGLGQSDRDHGDDQGCCDDGNGERLAPPNTTPTGEKLRGRVHEYSFRWVHIRDGTPPGPGSGGEPTSDYPGSPSLSRTRS